VLSKSTRDPASIVPSARSRSNAARVAALHRMRSDGAIRDGERVLLLLTAGHLIPLGQRSVPGWD